MTRFRLYYDEHQDEIDARLKEAAKIREERKRFEEDRKRADEEHHRQMLAAGQFYRILQLIWRYNKAQCTFYSIALKIVAFIRR